MIKYIIFDIDFCEKVNKEKSDKINIFLRNFDTDLNKRESFNDIDFEIIFT